MNSIYNKMGLWSSFLLILTFVGWILCFSGIALTSPVFYWTSLTNYLEYYRSNSQLLQNVAKALMLLMGPLFLIFVFSFETFASTEKKPLYKLTVLFALGFTVLSSMHYFIQLSSVRFTIEQGNTNALEYFVQANPASVSTAVDMLGWTIFLGLSTLFLSFMLESSRVFRSVKYAALLSGISCLLAGIGYIFKLDILTFVSINIGAGGALMFLSAFSFILFRKEYRKTN